MHRRALPGAVSSACITSPQIGGFGLPPTQRLWHPEEQLHQGEHTLRFGILAVAAATMLWVTPAFAGAAENAFLAKLVGTWTGTGTVTGTESATLACKLTYKANGDRVRFSGRCTAKGLEAPPQSFSGTMFYDDKSKQYLATGNGQTAAGVKTAGGVTFTTKLKQMGAVGTSVMKITAKSIVIDANITRQGTGMGGGQYIAHMTFKK
jgi:hypothetical protein